MGKKNKVALRATVGVIVTMNPYSGQGRVQERDFPENLKSLIRPVTMVVPDLQLIAEVMLFAEGFRSAVDIDDSSQDNPSFPHTKQMHVFVMESRTFFKNLVVSLKSLN